MQILIYKKPAYKRPLPFLLLLPSIRTQLRISHSQVTTSAEPNLLILYNKSTDISLAPNNFITEIKSIINVVLSLPTIVITQLIKINNGFLKI